MARRAKTLPIPILIVLLVAVGIGTWLKNRRAEHDGGNDTIVVESKNKNDRAPGGAAPAPGAPTSAGDNAALGMPSAASAETPDDYLIAKPQYVLSYNRSLGIPNWVAWHLSAADLGTAERSQFAPDPSLPKGWPRITPNDYRNIGYDRGHMAPSGDRTATKAGNAQTFLMTNIVPQAADNNQGPWADLEDYSRNLAKGGNELYIVSGVAGPFTRLPSGKLSVPGSVWKVILVLPEGSDDAGRVDPRTRVIAVMMPNENGIRDRDWKSFRTSVSAIEKATGYRFFSSVPANVRQSLESKVDTE